MPSDVTDGGEWRGSGDANDVLEQRHLVQSAQDELRDGRNDVVDWTHVDGRCEQINGGCLS